MTLIPEDKRRIYQCFCCGKEFELYTEYKEHILRNHEEGKDYVKCPLARCQAPIRDVRAHFKAIHKTEPLPRTGQMTALIWRDIRHTKKKRKFKQGWYDSTKMKKKLKYLSSWEETVFRCLDVWDDVLAFEAEPFKIPYLFEGVAHNYTPDIFIHFIDGHKEVWEIKPKNQKRLEINQSKWHSAQAACNNRGWEFKVITESDITFLKRKVKIKEE